ncbi:MAG TPA: hypothetical protein VIW47_15120 [Nitrospiraceae bacterium]|jgi:hypothetical protein
MHYLARLSFHKFVESVHTTDTASIILLSLLFIFVLMVVGAILYLYLSGALHATHMRPFRFALYILLLITAMTAGIKLILHSSEGCEAAVNFEDMNLRQETLSPRC